MRIHMTNTILYCVKWKETVAFYKTGLGLRVTMARDWFVEFELTAHSRLSVANVANATIGSSAGQGHTISLRVYDIEATHSFLVRAQLSPSAIRRHPWGARTTILHDPEGTRLEFWDALE